MCAHSSDTGVHAQREGWGRDTETKKDWARYTLLGDIEKKYVCSSQNFLEFDYQVWLKNGDFMWYSLMTSFVVVLFWFLVLFCFLHLVNSKNLERQRMRENSWLLSFWWCAFCAFAVVKKRLQSLEHEHFNVIQSYGKATNFIKCFNLWQTGTAAESLNRAFRSPHSLQMLP